MATVDPSTQKTSQGRWSKLQHQRFLDSLKLFGKNWKKIEQYIGTRTGAQIRSHSQKFFSRLNKELKQDVLEDSHKQNILIQTNQKEISAELLDIPKQCKTAPCSLALLDPPPEFFFQEFFSFPNQMDLNVFKFVDLRADKDKQECLKKTSSFQEFDRSIPSKKVKLL